jgi:F0F1-type ATP synthase membrane subunit b/b'
VGWVFNEIVHEIVTEVSEAPLNFVAEIVQFFILVGLVWLVAVGTSKRKGFVVNMLAERAQRTDARLEEACGREAELALAQQEADQSHADTEHEALQIVEAARAEADAITRTADRETQAEVERIEKRCDAALDAEKEALLAELRETLIQVVAQSTRSVLNERMPVADQRRLIEASILSSIEEASDSSPRQARSAVEAS